MRIRLKGKFANISILSTGQWKKQIIPTILIGDTYPKIGKEN